MKKSYLLLAFIFILSDFLSAQTYTYLFNNSFAEQGGSGPTLTEYLTNGASNGNFSSQSVTTSSGPCGTQTAFNFNAGGGLYFDNSSSLIGSTYTINMLFEFATLPGGSWQRIIDFDTTRDQGIYTQNAGCIRPSPNGLFVGSCPNQTAGQFTLFTLVRDGSDDSTFIYIDGALSESYLDNPTFLYEPQTPTSPILFFIDNAGDNEDGSGSIKYLSLTPITSTAAQVLNTWNTICTTVLPLQLLDFNANKQNSSVVLSWSTVREVNSSYFEIDRSSDGISFNKLTDVPANNNSATNNYSYTDQQPLSNNFYRLKMVDINGNFKYSSILKISFDGTQKIEFYPNPVSDLLTISGITPNVLIKLLSSDGKVLLQKRASGQSMTVDFSKYSSGLYIFQYFDGETIQNQKIIKQ